MLQFFRRYQKFFFLFVTIIIIMSFVFFGTFQAFLPSKDTGDDVLFTALDGSKIKRFHFMRLTHFLAEEDSVEGNFLNDGILSKDFLETKMGELVFARHQDLYKADLEERLKKEKSFQPYVHSDAKFLSAETVWALFAPDVKENLKKLKSLDTPSPLDLYKTKVALYLAEKKFPSQMLSQVLRYQERDHASLVPDLRLQRGDSLNLFGYRTLNDWFGQNYVDSLAAVILHGAAYAREKGLKVTREEAAADLLHRSEKAFTAMKEELPPQISNSKMLLMICMRQKGLDEENMIAVWQDILLFRRLMNEVGSSVLVDTLPMKEFYAQAGEKITVDVYEMAPCFQLQNKEDLFKFEAYLNALQPKRKNLLDLPTGIDSVETIEKRAPMLVATPFVLKYSAIAKKELHGKITAKETLEWQLGNHWEVLENRFPDLKAKKCESVEGKALALEGLDRKKRKEVDHYTRNQMLKDHPDWLEKALAEAKVTEKRVLFKEGEKVLDGIKDSKAISALLSTQDRLTHYSQDEEHYYNIEVKERCPKEVLDFASAKKLELPPPSGDIVNALFEEAKKQKLLTEEIDQEKRGDTVAPYRFITYLNKKPLQPSENPILKQWDLVKKEETVTRGSQSMISFGLCSAMEKDQFSEVKVSPLVGAYFFQVKDRKVDTSIPLEKMLEAQNILSTDAKEHFFERELLSMIDEKKGLALSKI